MTSYSVIPHWYCGAGFETYELTCQHFEQEVSMFETLVIHLFSLSHSYEGGGLLLLRLQSAHTIRSHVRFFFTLVFLGHL